MISMELPAHATQHGALHLGVGVGVNPGDPAGSALAAIHPHPQDPLALHHHNHGAATPGEENVKHSKAHIPAPVGFLSVYHHYLAINRKLIKSRTDGGLNPYIRWSDVTYRRTLRTMISPSKTAGTRLSRERAPCSVRNNRVS
ncbi:hypothetical protein ALC56_06568 [Trachymyrmex septentrionalis]|uniref:Uncharacterized protein n=1 Tax=Trachymyrmex septentrionalis TaxID=34720 RepID=A0A195FFZ3_9HYME|nr:hypothetical protein ALC56_06568 [Trachymyrmex septentrionalis]